MKKENLHYIKQTKTRSDTNHGQVANIKVFILPNLLTTGNLFFGFYSIVSSINGNFKVACSSIIIATVFDLLDGRVAKLTKSDSIFGAQYDALCDLVSFGVAPSLLMYFWALQPFGKFGWVASFLYVSCTALRLARFNSSYTTSGGYSTRIGQFGASNKISRHFQGLPSTAAAGVIASSVLFLLKNNIENYRQISLLLLTFTLAFLMVSNFKYRNFKDIFIKKRHFYMLVIAVLCFILLVMHTELTLFIFFTSYMLFGWLFSSKSLEG